MRRTSLLLRAGQLALRPSLRQRSDPDGTYEQILHRLRFDSEHGFAIGSAAVHDAFRARLRAYADMEGLSGIGWAIAKGEVEHRMNNIMRVQRLHAADPELARVPVKAPIFVVGMPRTGTTLAHNVIARARGARGPRLHEMFSVCGPEARTGRDLKRHKRSVEAQMRAFLRFSPDWDLIHPMRADYIEEDVFLKIHSWMNLGAGPLAGYPDYLKRDYDPVPEFRFLKAAAQVMTDPKRPTRWVFKHPGNLYHLSAILTVFPDAKIVWTHRNPVHVFGSMCSMSESLNYLHREVGAVDPHQIGADWLSHLAYGIETASAQKAFLLGQGVSRTQFIDLPYSSLMHQPFDYVADLLDKLELPFGDHEQRSLAQALDRPRDGRRHEYEMSRYGADTFTIHKAFGDYIRMVDRFDAQARMGPA